MKKHVQIENTIGSAGIGKTKSKSWGLFIDDNKMKFLFFSGELWQGSSQDFSKGGPTMSKWGYSPDCHYGQGIVMAFSPPVVGCLVKRGLQKGGHGHPRTPLATPLPWKLNLVFPGQTYNALSTFSVDFMADFRTNAKEVKFENKDSTPK